MKPIISRPTSTSFSKRLGRTLAQTDILALASLLDFVQCTDRLLQVSTRFNSVEIVQVRRGSEALDGAFDIFLDVFGGVDYAFRFLGFKVDLQQTEFLV